MSLSSSSRLPAATTPTGQAFVTLDGRDFLPGHLEHRAPPQTIRTRLTGEWLPAVVDCRLQADPVAVARCVSPTLLFADGYYPQ